MVQGQRLSAALAEADVAAQPVKQNFVDLVGNPFPGIVEPVLIHRTAEGLGERKIEVQLSVILLEKRQSGRFLRQAGLLNGFSPLPAVEELKKQVPQGVLDRKSVV